ncbi:hypothetical protein ACJMK2_001317 [Sinanodonta woodiana]|uniref:Protein kinase domain-containing protein n=1 Tax=Sinanodonta woodiana TaxID=1069815 RepID=A0ABD3XVA1_SINWO
MEETENICQETSGSNDIAMETDGPKLTITSVTDPSFQDVQTGGSLSPDTVQQLHIMLQCLRRGEAFLDQDEKGRPVIQYEQKSKLLWDASNANMITECATDVKMKMESCFEFIDYLKKQKPPSGVVLDKTQVHTNRGMYREGYEFEKTKKVLGSGTMAGDIVVIKDKKTGMESAQKTIMISVFRKEEIQAWVDLAETGFAPALYLFKLEGNKVVIEMEIVSEAKTLRTIIDEYLFRMDASLTKPFSLYILDGLLEATIAIHDKGWVHRDLHPGNIMMQKQMESKLRVRIIDFGMAQSFDGSQGLQFEPFRRDIREVVRIFSALYCGQEFDSAHDLQRNWQSKINEVNLADEDKRELFCLIDSAMKIVHPQDVPKFHGLVQDKLQSALPDAQSHDDMMRRVLAILFPDIKDFRSIHPEVKENYLPESRPLDVADSVVRKPPHSTSVKHQDVADSRVPAYPIIPEEILVQFRLSLSIRVA